MAIYDAKSRYAVAERYTVTDATGRAVTVVAVPDATAETILGWHRHRDGQRLDHLAAHYLDDPAGFWRIATLNGALSAEALTTTRLIAVPNKTAAKPA